MLTRCPQCATRYRVHGEQLDVAGGKVRCGRCGCVFEIQLNVKPAVEPPESDVGEVVIMERRPQPESKTEPHAEDVTDAEEAITVSGPPPHPSSPTRKRGLGVAIVLLLLLVLAIQVVWWQRQALASHPVGLQLVRMLCRVAPCQARPPRAPERIEVLERGLEPHPEQPDALRFHLRMVNRAPLAQPFPEVELRLLDARQQPLGVRRFTPEQYLGGSGGDLLDPDTPAEVELDLVSPGNHVSGFRLDFY
jgi:predicted Zn finger-like uncharacterized protein